MCASFALQFKWLLSLTRVNEHASLAFVPGAAILRDFIAVVLEKACMLTVYFYPNHWKSHCG